MTWLLRLLGGLITGGASGGSAIGNAVTFAGIVAALSPIALWFLGHRDEILVTITYADAVFWGLIIAAQLAIASASRRGAPPAAGRDWNSGRD